MDRPAEERRFRWSTLIWIVAAVAGWFAVTRFVGSVDVIEADRADRAGPVTFVATDGRALSLDGLRGKVVLINLWASWCEPCRRETPMLEALHRELEGDGLVVLGLNDDLTPAAIPAVAEDWGISYRTVKLAGAMPEAFGTPEAIPHSWIVDREGRIRVSHTGVPTLRSIRAACKRLVGES